uniref:Uncharacterized protein n=1 Tax=Anguilla anguilla TaxID=7936 RepID=A0A0E9PR20_ANGAN
MQRGFLFVFSASIKEYFSDRKSFRH